MANQKAGGGSSSTELANAIGIAQVSTCISSGKNSTAYVFKTEDVLAILHSPRWR